MRIFIVLLFFLATSLSALELSVPPLKPQKILINSIAEFNNSIIVRTNSLSEKKKGSSLWKLNHHTKVIVPYLDKNNNKVIAIFKNKNNLQVYASKKGNFVFLNYLDNEKRNVILRIVEDQVFKLAVNRKFTYLIFKDKIILIYNKIIKKIKLPTLDIFSRNNLPSSIAISETNLFLGYNNGEWGGALYKLPIGVAGEFMKNRNIIGKNILGENIDTIKLDIKDNLWVTTSLAHLAGVSSGLYKYNNIKIETIIKQNGLSIGKKTKFKSTGNISLPKLTTINGMTVRKDNNIIFVAPSVGVLSVNKSLNLSYLWRGNLYFSYEESQKIVNDSKEEVIKFSVGSRPEGIVIKKKKMFIASRSLGVLEFSRKNNGNYIPTSQYIFSSK